MNPICTYYTGNKSLSPQHNLKVISNEDQRVNQFH